MNVDVRFRALAPSAALAQHATTTATQRFERFAPQIESVVLRLSDVNGPRGGLDKTCHVSVHGAFGRTSVEEKGSDPYVVVSRAIERAAGALDRNVGRRRDRSVAARRAVE